MHTYCNLSLQFDTTATAVIMTTLINKVIKHNKLCPAIHSVITHFSYLTKNDANLFCSC